MLIYFVFITSLSNSLLTPYTPQVRTRIPASCAFPAPSRASFIACAITSIQAKLYSTALSYSILILHCCIVKTKAKPFKASKYLGGDETNGSATDSGWSKKSTNLKDQIKELEKNSEINHAYPAASKKSSGYANSLAQLLVAQGQILHIIIFEFLHEYKKPDRSQNQHPYTWNP